MLIPPQSDHHTDLHNPPPLHRTVMWQGSGVSSFRGVSAVFPPLPGTPLAAPRVHGDGEHRVGAEPLQRRPPHGAPRPPGTRGARDGGRTLVRITVVGWRYPSVISSEFSEPLCSTDQCGFLKIVYLKSNKHYNFILMPDVCS